MGSRPVQADADVITDGRIRKEQNPWIAASRESKENVDWASRRNLIAPKNHHRSFGIPVCAENISWSIVGVINKPLEKAVRGRERIMKSRHPKYNGGVEIHMGWYTPQHEGGGER